ncbi:MAG: hypothetical protein AB7U63_09665 [Porticoccaceae bacterium]
MLSSLARKTFNFYTAPARFAIRQGRRNIDFARQCVREARQFQSELDRLIDALLQDTAIHMEIDLATMTQAQRQDAAKIALYRAEQGLSLALEETLKALVLLAADSSTSRLRKPSNLIIEGECQPAPFGTVKPKKPQ